MNATTCCLRCGGVSVLALALTLAAAPAAAADWSADLVVAPGDFRGTTDPIQIELHAAPPEVHERLYVLLDELDVTEFASIEGGIYTIDFPVPLSPGSYELRLLEYLPDGSLVLRGRWTLVLRQTGFFESNGLSVNVTQNVTDRVAEHDTPGLPTSLTADGAASIYGAVEKSGLRLSGSAPLLWDTLEENYGGDNITIGNWLLEGAGAPATLRLGHQQPAMRTLAMDGFSRRGVSGRLGSERLRSSITGFTVRGNAISGFHDGLGIGESDNRISGVSMGTKPIDREWGQLALNGVWFTGRAPANGGPVSGVVGDDSTMDGSTWAFEGLATILDGRVQAGGGFSRSRSEFSGSSSLTDNAHTVTVLLDPFPDFSVAEYLASWRVTLDQSTIGTDYLSLGNPGLASDRETWAARSDFELAGFSLNAYGGRITDNVEDDDEIPRFRIDNWSVEGAFTPAQLLDGERRGVLRWLGMPTLVGSFRRDRLKPTRIPAGFVEPEKLSNARTDSSYLNLEFAYDSVSWAVGHTIIDTNDFTPDARSSVLHQTEVRADAYWGEFGFGGGFQLDREKRKSDTDQSSYLVSFNLRMPVLPQRIYFSGNTSFNWRQTQDDSVDVFSVNAGGSIDWAVFEATEIRPGLTLSFVGNYQGNSDHVDSSLDQSAYQLYLRATLAWPITLGSL